MNEEHNQPITLCIDTSTATLSIALLKGEQLLSEINEQVGRQHSDRLLPAIQQLLTAEHMSMRDIEHIAVGHGPGSYTGVRIGVTAAKTLAWTLSVPITTISSLELLAYGVIVEQVQAYNMTQPSDINSNQVVSEQQTDKYWIIPTIDARRKRAYTALYEVSPVGWSCLIPDGVQQIDEWLPTLTERYRQTSEVPERIIFAGETDLLVESMSSLAKINAHIETMNTYVRAATLGVLARQPGRHPLTKDNVHHIVPNYTQMTEAEARLAANQQN